MSSKKGKKKKYRIKPIPAVILSVIAVAIVTLIVIGIVKLVRHNSNDDNKVNVSVSGVGNQPQTITDTIVKVTVKIDMESCLVPVGTSIKATATVVPTNSDTAVVWSSSDNNIFTVTSEGVITVKAEGIAALTATVGNVSDAIVIEGIKDAAQADNADLPMYNAAGNNSSQQNNNIPGNTTQNNNTPGNTPGNISQNNNTSGNTPSNTPSNTTQNDNTSDDSTPDGSTPDDNTPDGSTPDDNSSGNNTSGDNGDSGAGALSTDLYGILGTMGYEQHLSNVFVYGTGDNYDGEIIIEQNVAIIYIKQKNDDFVAKIMEVLEQLLPGYSGQVWNTYSNSGSDTTFTINGRMVRIVKAMYGGHSQIVVYN